MSPFFINSSCNDFLDSPRELRTLILRLKNGVKRFARHKIWNNRIEAVHFVDKRIDISGRETVIKVKMNGKRKIDIVPIIFLYTLIYLSF
jgi:hypothetical protein